MECEALVRDMSSLDGMESVIDCSSSIPSILQVAIEADHLLYDESEQLVCEDRCMALHIQVWVLC